MSALMKEIRLSGQAQKKLDAAVAAKRGVSLTAVEARLLKERLDWLSAERERSISEMSWTEDD